MAKKETGAVPAGFQRVETGSFPPNHDFKKSPRLQGKVIQIKDVPQKRGKKTEEVRVIYVADENGEVSAVWESHAIADGMAKLKAGDEVLIEFKGVQKLKGKKTLKNFDFFIKPKGGK
jgi:hypothetical protein